VVTGGTDRVERRGVEKPQSLKPRATSSAWRTFTQALVATSTPAMGNRALVNALDRMTGLTRKRFSEIMLTAPDIDAATFVQPSDGVTRHAERTTLYASNNDAALAASKRLHGAYPRAGEAGSGVLIVPPSGR
jgi:hypothetical protein